MTRRISYFIPIAGAFVLMGGCASHSVEVAQAPPPVHTPTPLPRPEPPSGAAPTLTIPTWTADGSYPTPNRDLSEAARIWHVRAALNVAALMCAPNDPQPAAEYSQWIKAHKQALASAHATLNRQYRERYGSEAQARFDDSMTRLYNFFAQPPVTQAFCAAARPLVAEAASLTAGGLDAFAARALPQLDSPFTGFYARYDAYRQALARWRRGQAPILAVTPAVLMTGTRVTGDGRVEIGAR